MADAIPHRQPQRRLWCHQRSQRRRRSPGEVADVDDSEK